jgi:hypothetical protein
MPDIIYNALEETFPELEEKDLDFDAKLMRLKEVNEILGYSSCSWEEAGYAYDQGLRHRFYE